MYCFHRGAHSEQECSCACALCTTQKQRLIIDKNNELIRNRLTEERRKFQEFLRDEQQRFNEEMNLDENFKREFEAAKKKLETGRKTIKYIPIKRIEWT